MRTDLLIHPSLFFCEWQTFFSSPSVSFRMINEQYLCFRRRRWRKLLQPPGLHFLFAIQDHAHHKGGKKTDDQTDRVQTETRIVMEGGKSRRSCNDPQESDEILYPGSTRSVSQYPIGDPTDGQAEEHGPESDDKHKNISFSYQSLRDGLHLRAEKNSMAAIPDGPALEKMLRLFPLWSRFPRFLGDDLPLLGDNDARDGRIRHIAASVHQSSLKGIG